MEYEFYIDQFFLTTLFYNYLSLYLSSIFLRVKRKYWRLLFGAALGSSWNCLLILFPVLKSALEVLVTIPFVGSLMVMIAFKIHDLKKIAAAVGALTVSAMFVGGIVSLAKQRLWLGDWEILVLIAGLYYLSERFLNNVVRTPMMGKERYPVRLFYCGQERAFQALADSGNRLHVPGTDKPVSIISRADCTGFCDRISCGFYIPYRAVGTKRGLLFATKFEKMEIQKDGEWICIRRPIVAIATEELSSDHSFSMILPEEYVR